MEGVRDCYGVHTWYHNTNTHSVKQDHGDGTRGRCDSEYGMNIYIPLRTYHHSISFECGSFSIFHCAMTLVALF